MMKLALRRLVGRVVRDIPMLSWIRRLGDPAVARELKLRLSRALPRFEKNIAHELSQVRHLGNPVENEKLASSEYQAGKAILESLPSIVTYALTTYCFTGKDICLICDRNSRDPNADSHSTKQAIRAVTPLLKTATHVFLHCGGEAMYSPHFDEVISLIDPPTRALFATNGMALTRKRTDLMLERDIMGEIMISLDAATPEMLRIMRPACSLETIAANTAYYTERTRALNRETVSSVVLGMTVCEANLLDVPRFVDLAERLGARFVEYNHLNAGLNHVLKTVDGADWVYTEQAKFKDPVLHDNLILEAYKRAKSRGIKMMFIGTPFLGPEKDEIDSSIKSEISRHGDPATQPNTVDPWVSRHHRVFSQGVPSCVKPWREIVIQPTGVVRACYFHDEGTLNMGDIVKTDFMEIWNSREMVEHRKQFLSRGVSDLCLASYPCMYRGRQ
jgi:MoaA/NifB/PqqE/SkfB family radical SAM enzyme